MPKSSTSRLSNPASRTFRDLHRAFQQDAAAPQVGELAAKLSSEVAAIPFTVCVGNFEKSERVKILSLAYLLKPYGVTLRQRWLKHRQGWFFVYAEIERPTEPAYVGVALPQVPVTRGVAAA